MVSGVAQIPVRLLMDEPNVLLDEPTNDLDDWCILTQLRFRLTAGSPAGNISHERHHRAHHRLRRPRQARHLADAARVTSTGAWR